MLNAITHSHNKKAKHTTHKGTKQMLGTSIPHTLFTCGCFIVVYLIISNDDIYKSEL